MRTSAFICGHLRSSADICVHVRSLKNRSVLGPRFLCAGAVLGSPTFQNPRAHRSNSIGSKVVVLPTRNDSFQKKHAVLPRQNASLRKMVVPEDGSGTLWVLPERSERQMPVSEGPGYMPDS